MLWQWQQPTHFNTLRWYCPLNCEGVVCPRLFAYGNNWSPVLGIYRGRHDFILSTCFFIMDFWKFDSIPSFCFVSVSFSPSLQCFCWIYILLKNSESNVDVKSKGSTPILCWLLLRWLISRKWLISLAKYFLILSLVFSPEHALVSVVIWTDWEFSKPLSSGSFLSDCPSISFLSHFTISSKETLCCTTHTAYKYQSLLFTSYIFCPTLEQNLVKLPATSNKNHLSSSFQEYIPHFHVRSQEKALTFIFLPKVSSRLSRLSLQKSSSLNTLFSSLATQQHIHFWCQNLCYFLRAAVTKYPFIFLLVSYSGMLEYKFEILLF